MVFLYPANCFWSCTGQGQMKELLCWKTKSLNWPRRSLAIVPEFYQLQPPYRLSQDFGVNVKVVTRIYQSMREARYHFAK